MNKTKTQFINHAYLKPCIMLQYALFVYHLKSCNLAPKIYYDELDLSVKKALTPKIALQNRPSVV